LGFKSLLPALIHDILEAVGHYGVLMQNNTFPSCLSHRKSIWQPTGANLIWLLVAHGDGKQPHITYPLPQNPTFDQVNRQISFTTAFINDLPRARGQFTSVSHSSQPFHLADFFRHELERDNRPKNKYTNHTQAAFYLAQRKRTFNGNITIAMTYPSSCLETHIKGDEKEELKLKSCCLRLLTVLRLARDPDSGGSSLFSSSLRDRCRPSHGFLTTTYSA
jgi:hypothetical protein